MAPTKNNNQLIRSSIEVLTIPVTAFVCFMMATTGAFAGMLIGPFYKAYEYSQKEKANTVGVTALAIGGLLLFPVLAPAFGLYGLYKGISIGSEAYSRIKEEKNLYFPIEKSIPAITIEESKNKAERATIEMQTSTTLESLNVALSENSPKIEPKARTSQKSWPAA